jgi:hypothetical protein
LSRQTFFHLCCDSRGYFLTDQVISELYKKLVDKATKALYEVLKWGRLHNLSIQCQLDLFDKIVQSILLYGCEIWGFTNTAMIERIHLRFCKFLVHFKKQLTPDFMIYGELGRYPMEIKRSLIGQN